MTLTKNTGGYYADGKRITPDQYNTINAKIDSKPTPPAGHDYRLTDALEWELYELPPAEPELPTIEEKAAAYDILTGGGTV